MYKATSTGIELYWEVDILITQIVEECAESIKSVSDGQFEAIVLTRSDKEVVKEYIEKSLTNLYLIFLNHSTVVEQSLYCDDTSSHEGDFKTGFSIKVPKNSSGDISYNPSRVEFIDIKCLEFIVISSLYLWAKNVEVPSIEKRLTEELFAITYQIKSTLIHLRPTIYNSCFTIVE